MSDGQPDEPQDEAKAKEERRQTRLGCGFTLAIVVAIVSAIMLIVGRGGGDGRSVQESVKASPASCEMLRQDMVDIFAEFSEEAGIPTGQLRVATKSQALRIISLDGTDGVIHSREVLPSGVVVGGMSCYGVALVEFQNGERAETSVAYEWVGRPKGIQMYTLNEDPHRDRDVMIHAQLRLVPEGVD